MLHIMEYKSKASVDDENCAYVSSKEYCAYIYIIDQKHTYNT